MAKLEALVFYHLWWLLILIILFEDQLNVLLGWMLQRSIGNAEFLPFDSFSDIIPGYVGNDIKDFLLIEIFVLTLSIVKFLSIYNSRVTLIELQEYLLHVLILIFVIFQLQKYFLAHVKKCTCFFKT